VKRIAKDKHLFKKKKQKNVNFSSCQIFPSPQGTNSCAAAGVVTNARKPPSNPMSSTHFTRYFFCIPSTGQQVIHVVGFSSGHGLDHSSEVFQMVDIGCFTSRLDGVRPLPPFGLSSPKAQVKPRSTNSRNPFF